MNRYHKKVPQDVLDEFKRQYPEKFEQLKNQAAREIAFKVQTQRNAEYARVQQQAEREEQRQLYLHRVDTALVTTQLPHLDLSGVHGILALRQWGYRNIIRYDWNPQLHAIVDSRKAAEGCLVSTAFQNTEWSEIMTADIVPTEYNQHGLYGIKLDAVSLITTVGSYLGEVCGIIEMRGKVVEHGEGILRAEWAQIRCIFVSAECREVYDVVPKLRATYPYVPLFVLTKKQIAGVLLREALRWGSLWE